MPLGPVFRSPPKLVPERPPPPVLTPSIRFRHFIDGSLSLVSPDRTWRNQVPPFPRRSRPSLLTTAARGGLEPAPDRRLRGALPHLSHSSTPPSLSVCSWHTMIFRVFGIRRSVVRRKEHIQRISEVVGHRNAIAHGEDKAEDVGRRYTRSEIVKMIRQMKSVCLLQISVFDEFCADKGRYLRK